MGHRHSTRGKLCGNNPGIISMEAELNADEANRKASGCPHPDDITAAMHYTIERMKALYSLSEAGNNCHMQLKDNREISFTMGQGKFPSIIIKDLNASQFQKKITGAHHLTTTTPD
jgi:hypothetical protein